MAWELILWLLSFVSVISLIAMTAYQFFRQWCIECALLPVSNSFFVGITLLQLDDEGLFLILFPKIQLICLSDLEFDYINPYDSSSRINSVVIPEYIVQGLLCTSFLLTWHWFPFLITAPVTYYHVKLFMNKKHLIDVTEIFRQLNGEKKQRLIKLVFYLSLFVIVIYRLVITAVALLMEEDMDLLDSATL